MSPKVLMALTLAVPLIATSDSLLKASVSAACGLSVLAGSALFKTSTLKLICAVSVISLFELALQALNTNAFNDLKNLLGLWLLLALAPRKAFWRSAPAIGVGAVLLGGLRELTGQSSLLAEASSWFGGKALMALNLPLPSLNHSAIIMLLAGLGLYWRRKKGKKR